MVQWLVCFLIWWSIDLGNRKNLLGYDGIHLEFLAVLGTVMEFKFQQTQNSEIKKWTTKIIKTQYSLAVRFLSKRIFRPWPSKFIQFKTNCSRPTLFLWIVHFRPGSLTWQKIINSIFRKKCFVSLVDLEAGSDARVTDSVVMKHNKWLGDNTFSVLTSGTSFIAISSTGTRQDSSDGGQADWTDLNWFLWIAIKDVKRGPLANWGIPIAAMADCRKWPEIISPNMTGSLESFKYSPFARSALSLCPWFYWLSDGWGSQSVNLWTQMNIETL